MPEDVALSKRLAYVLRHRPDSAGLVLDSGGWVSVAELCLRLDVSRARIEAVVAASSKQRYAMENGRIRASQGHSVPVELGYASREPPALLWHGTATRNLDLIRREGLRRGGRHAVHLSPDAATARDVGSRHGTPCVLRVHSRRMFCDGHLFNLSANGVWLVEHVPPSYLTPLR